MKHYARKIREITDISESVLLCLPDSVDEKWLMPLLQGCSRNAEAITDPDPLILKEQKKPAIVLGNLSDSKTVRDLYFRFLAATDRWYPGPGGYEIRTLLDPYGYGENIIHVGYSDKKGLGEALEKIREYISVEIPKICEIHPTRIHIHDSEAIQIRAMKPPELKWMNVARDIYKKGYLGYLTGDMELVGAYLDMWRAIVSYPIKKGDQKIKDLHLRMGNLVQSFRLMETAGLIADEDLRERIAAYIIEWPDTDQGLTRIDLADYMHPEFPRQNHGMIPALGLAFLIDYCRTYGFKTTDIAEWENLVEKAFHPYMDGSWKPVCDGTCHGWWLSQPALLEYGLIEPKHRYFEKGGARKAAEAAIDLVNNNGIMPASGDFNLLRAFPGISLRHALAYYMDGRYRFVHDLAPVHLCAKYHVYMPRMFDTGIKPVEPRDRIGISVTPMDPLIYDSWEKAPGLVREMLDAGPAVPIGRTFDKIAVRTGWKKKDQYLLIDGLGNNPNHTHSYPNTLGIVDYYHKGESWIIEESGSKFPEPENLSVLTISKKGDEFIIPSFGELVGTRTENDRYYIKVRLNDYSKTDWTREITMVRDKGILISDTVEFKEDGQYTVTSHLRTPGKAVIEDNRLKSKRAGHEFTIEAYCSVDFRLGIHGNNLGLTYRNHKGEPKPIVPEEDMERAWEERYHTKDRMVTSLDSRVSKTFKKGDKIVFMHIAAVDVNPGEELTAFMDDGLYKGEYSYEEEKEGNIKSKEWMLLERILREEIHSYCILEDLIYVGHGKRSLSCLDSNHGIVWTKKIEREPTYCYWWELDYPSAVEVKAFSHNDEDYIIVGCGDLFIRCMDNKGNERWRFQYINGVPGRINIFDSDGDGIPEILAGGEIISNRSQCRVIGLDGTLKYELDAEFWTSRLTAYADLSIGDERYVALGANRGRNLHLYRTFGRGNSNPEKLIEKRLPGTIDKIELGGNGKILTAHSSEGFSVSYKFR